MWRRRGAIAERHAGRLGRVRERRRAPACCDVVLAGDATPAALNAALVAAGIRVSALVPERDTLEDVFLHLVEGIDVPR